uniref:Uncharacterized protein n=1 Tax=Caenorhabditis tropicalis TaxID=1561998 RepID=A0A1I7TC83_9PELO
MGESLVAEPTTTEPSPLSTNSVAYHKTDDLPPPAETFGFEEISRAFIVLCENYSLDKKQVALGLFLSFLLVIFSVGTILAWNRYNPIIQEFIIKENIEKARIRNNDKNKKEE